MIAVDPNEKDNDGKPKPRKPWSRTTTNRQVKRLRAMIRWGVSFELVNVTVVDALDTNPKQHVNTAIPQLSVRNTDFARLETAYA